MKKFEELLTLVGDLMVTNAVFTWQRGAEPVKWVFWTVKSPINTNAVISIQMQSKIFQLSLRKDLEIATKKKPKQLLRNIVNDFVMHIQEFFLWICIQMSSCISKVFMNMHSNVMHIQWFIIPPATKLYGGILVSPCPSVCRQILCRTITWVVFLRIL